MRCELPVRCVPPHGTIWIFILLDNAARQKTVLHCTFLLYPRRLASNVGSKFIGSRHSRPFLARPDETLSPDCGLALTVFLAVSPALKPRDRTDPLAPSLLPNRSSSPHTLLLICSHTPCLEVRTCRVLRYVPTARTPNTAFRVTL